MFEGIDTKLIQEKPKTIVRLQTSYWNTHAGVFMKKSIKMLRRKSNGFDLLVEDAYNIGAEEVFPKIVNLDECEDGIYEVITCNVQRDWESGYAEDWDYQLIPFIEEPKDVRKV